MCKGKNNDWKTKCQFVITLEAGFFIDGSAKTEEENILTKFNENKYLLASV